MEQGIIGFEFSLTYFTPVTLYAFVSAEFNYTTSTTVFTDYFGIIHHVPLSINAKKKANIMAIIRISNCI